MSEQINYNELFHYNPDTGDLIWSDVGLVAGYLHKATGHVYVNCKGKMRKAHRIIWEMHYGPIPEGMLIDHINMNGADNRLENLRLATKAQNGWNRKGKKGSVTGLKGVSMDKRDGRFQAEIRVNGERIRLGRYRTKGEAAVAYAKAALRYHGEFARV